MVDSLFMPSTTLLTDPENPFQQVAYLWKILNQNSSLLQIQIFTFKSEIAVLVVDHHFDD